MVSGSERTFSDDIHKLVDFIITIDVDTWWGKVVVPSILMLFLLLCFGSCTIHRVIEYKETAKHFEKGYCQQVVELDKYSPQTVWTKNCKNARATK